MKKQLFLFVLILVSLIIAAGGMSNWPRIYIKPTTTFAGGVSGSDSTKIISPDTLKIWLISQGFTDLSSLADSIAALEHRGYITLDSASVVLRLAMIDSSKAVWDDSTHAALVVIPNDLRVGSEITVIDSLHFSYGASMIGTSNGLELYDAADFYVGNGGISVATYVAGDSSYFNTSKVKDTLRVGDQVEYTSKITSASTYLRLDPPSSSGTVVITDNILGYGNGANIQNPSSGLVTINSANITATSDSMDVNGVLNVDTLYTKKIQQTDSITIKSNYVKIYPTTRFVIDGSKINTANIIGVDTETKIGYGTKTKNHDTVFGYLANLSANGGEANTAFGSKALQSKSNGFFNIALGYEAGSNITTGDGNIMIGNSITATTAGSDSLINIGNTFKADMRVNNKTITLDTDSTDIDGVLNFDSLKNASGLSLYNSHADTTQFTETAFKFVGNQLVKGTFAIRNGSTTTFTQIPNRLTISGNDTLKIEKMTNINPYPTSPQSSTFLGINAGKLACSGADNIVIGNNAGDALTTGGGNVFIGTDAGGANTTGEHNTFVGFSAGKANTAAGNSFYGYYAGISNVAALSIGNCYFGKYSGRYSTGKYNSFYGLASGARMTGNGNTLMGNYAGGQASGAVGSFNDCFGDSTGVNLSSGRNNKFIGAYSGLNITSGNRNLIWGDFKGGISPDSMVYIDNTGKDSTNALITGNMSSGVNNRSVIIDGYNYFKKIIARFKRTDTFTCSAPDVWQTIPITVANGTANTWHYTATSGVGINDSCIVMQRAQWNEVDATFGVYFGVATSESVEFRLVKGAVSGGRSYSLSGQQKDQATRTTTDEKKYMLHDDGYFASGDSLILQMRVSDTGIILKSLPDFNNPNSGTVNIKYIGDN